MPNYTPTGRSKTDAKHVRVYDRMQQSEAWKASSGNAIKALLYLASFENADNNGELFLSARLCAEGINVTKKTANRALQELEDRGFIRATERGHFRQKGGPATKWRLTWKPWPGGRLSATNEWEKWKPEEKSRASFLPAAVVESPHMNGTPVATGVKSTPVATEDPQKRVDRQWVKRGTHTLATVGASAEPVPAEQSTPEIASGDFLIREQVAQTCRHLSPAARHAVARSANITLSELDQFVAGRVDLTIGKQVALRAAVRAAA